MEMGKLCVVACFDLSAILRSLSAARTSCSRVSLGILKLCAYHLTISTIRVDDMESVHMRWHL